MTTMNEMLEKFQLKELVDNFSTLDDENAVEQQMKLLTEDAQITAYIGDELYSDMKGIEDIEPTFKRLLSGFKGVYHLNGQQVIRELTDTTAKGIIYCHVVLVEERDGKDIIHNNYGRYQDEYQKVNGEWKLHKRVARFTIADSRELGR